MTKKLITTAAILGTIAIILVLLSSCLKESNFFRTINHFETGVRYQMYHALFLLFLSLHNTLADKSKKPS
jgi:uncharacterized membrane protein YgdD (TMEM256/DUF423 family)